MKLHLTCAARQGNTLLITLCVVVIAGVALTSYLRVVSNHEQLVYRSQAWNACLAVVEAGIEEALTHLSCNYRTNMVADGWRVAGAFYVKSNAVLAAAGTGFVQGRDGHYVVQITRNVPYRITSRGYYPFRGGETFVTRAVQVATTNNGVFVGGMFARNRVDLNGNNVLCDSFDSRDPAKSTNSRYDVAKRGDNGDIGCTLGLTNSLNVGNADVWGQVLTGPYGTPAIGPNGSVGDLAFHAAGKTGLQDGWWLNDLNVSFPDISKPFATANAFVSSGTVGGVAYDQIFSTGNFDVSSMGGKVLITGDATVYVSGDVDFIGASALLRIAPGANLKLYVGGTAVRFVTVVNSGVSTNFLTYGLPSVTTVDLKTQGAEFIGGIYAPNASFFVNGSTQISGAVVCRDAKMNGNTALHYDEALGLELPSRGYVVTSWNEL